MAMATQTMTDVPSASAVAMAAASARPLKPRPSPLPTPQTATFASALQSPLPSASRLGSASLGSATFLRAEKSLKTPLTPPSQYLDFLNNVNKGKSPLNTSTSAHFTFSAGPRSPYPWPSKQQSASPRPTFITQDSTESNQSNHTSASGTSIATTTSTVSTASAPAKPLVLRSHYDQQQASPPRSVSTSQLPTRPHPHQQPPLRRPSLMIPESPSIRSPSLMSPASGARSAPYLGVSRRNLSPPSATAAKNYYLGLTPITANGDRSAISSAGGNTTRPFKIRQIITRTITSKRPAGSSAPNSAIPKSTTSAVAVPYIPMRSFAASRPSTSSNSMSDEDTTGPGSSNHSKGKMSLDFVLSSSNTANRPSAPTSVSGAGSASDHDRDDAARKHKKTPEKMLDRDSEMDDMSVVLPPLRLASSSQNHSRNHSVQRSPEQAPWGLPPPLVQQQIPLVGEVPQGKRRRVE